MSKFSTPPPILQRPPQISVGESQPGTVAETLKWIFVGKGGIRAGWSVLIFIILSLIVAIGGVVIYSLIAHPKAPHGGISWTLMLPQELILVVAMGAATFVMALIEGRRPSAYFLTDHSALLKLAVGGLCGLVSMTSLVGLLIGIHALSIDRLLLTPAQMLGMGAVWLAVFVAVGIFEEGFFRGYLQFTLTRGINFWWAAVITSTVFALVHLTNGGENPIGILNVFAAGALLCWILRVTGSLYLAIGFHATWDWAQSFLFGVADSGGVSPGRLLQTHPVGSPLLSGGSAGPEGSLLAFAVMGLAAYVIWAGYGKSLAVIDTRGPVEIPG